MNQRSLKLNIGSMSYFIKIGSNLLNEETLRDIIRGRETMLILDKNIDNSTIEKLISLLKDISGFPLLIEEINAIEENKTQTTLTRIHSSLIEAKFSRESILIGMGGGIICDLTGFAAATYQRGVDFCLIPTSLLAQVDASVGGKTAINHPLGKNMIGAFHQPTGVITDISFLQTLPSREICCGLVEMVKHGLIGSKDYFNWLEKNIQSIVDLEPKIIEESIAKSIQIKADIVSQDERELNQRALLNFGHTFGHAIELINDFKKYKHGEAVALGMLPALELSKLLGKISQKDIERIRQFLERINICLQPQDSIDKEELYEAMLIDKKKRGNSLNFIVLEEIGKAKLVNDIPKDTVLEAIEVTL